MEAQERFGKNVIIATGQENLSANRVEVQAEADVFPAMELAARNVLLAVAEDSPNVYHATVAELNNAACAWVEVTISTAANVSHVVVEV